MFILWDVLYDDYTVNQVINGSYNGMTYNDGLVLGRSTSSALAMEILQSCIKPSLHGTMSK